MTDFDPDRAKAARVLQALPPDARLLSALHRDSPMRRIPDWLAEAVYRAHEALTADPVDFIDPDVACAHRALINTLDALGEGFSDTFPPDGDGDFDYTEVPSEWRRTDPGRYYETLQSLSTARQAVVNSYKELVSAMNRAGQMPSPQPPQDPGPGQNFNITSGNDSPVNITAANAHASGGSTANANSGHPQAPTPTAATDVQVPWWNRSIVLWTALGSLAAVAGVIIAVYK